METQTKKKRQKLSGFIIYFDNNTYFLVTTQQKKTNKLAHFFLSNLRITPTDERTQRVKEKLQKATITCVPNAKNQLFYVARTNTTKNQPLIYSESELIIIEVK